MDTRTGSIYTMDEALNRKDRSHLVQMNIPPTAEQLRRGKVGRNDPCPCGSGMKFKKCCYMKG